MKNADKIAWILMGILVAGLIVACSFSAIHDQFAAIACQVSGQCTG